jgi:hypothetical protein
MKKRSDRLRDASDDPIAAPHPIGLSSLSGLFRQEKPSGHCEERSDEAISYEDPLP